MPVGLALIAVPALLAVFESLTATLGAIAAVFGLLVLSKGLRVGTFLAELSVELSEALYGGRVSVVTYVVASGLTLVGGFLGVLGASPPDAEGAVELLVFVQFVHEAIPWFTGATLVAGAGRLVDGLLREEALGSYLNLPFVAVAVGLAVRGFTTYFLRISGATGPLRVPTVSVGRWTLDGFAVTPGTHLAAFILAGIAVSLVGVRVAAYASGTAGGSSGRRI